MTRELLARLLAEHGEEALRDVLTDCYNRRLLDVLLEKHWAELTAAHTVVSLIVIDLDLFKEVNDTYGHLVGDRVLREAAELLRTHFRSNDIVVRYGGDEFVVLLPGVAGADAGKLADRARTAMGEHRFSGPVGETAITVSVSFSLGVASAPDDGTSAEAVLACADQRLFADKRRRRSATAAGGTWRLSARAWVGVAGVVALVITLLVLALSATKDRSAPTQKPNTAHEVELLREIRALQAQIATLSARSASGADAASRARIDELRARVGALEGQLADRRVEQSQQEPSPTPPPSPPTEETSRPSTIPSGVATPAPVSETPLGGAVGQVEAETPPAGPSPPAGEPVVAPPRLIRFVPPIYPEAALRSRREASVVLRVRVSVQGRVLQAEPAGPPLGLGFDFAAREAALRALYQPATRDGQPIEMETALIVQFRLGPRS